MGYNWRSTLSDFAAISGVLAGFCFALIVFVLGWSVANTALSHGVTYGNVGVLLTGVSASLFIAASELLLSAKHFDVWALPDKFEQNLQASFKDWIERKTEDDRQCKLYERRGRTCYNIGAFLLFVALLFIMSPYNLVIAAISTGLGLIFEVYQLVMQSRRQTPS
jgi:hypothetical protein